MKQDFFDTLLRVSQRSTSAIVARAGTQSQPLRAYIAEVTRPEGIEPFVREPFLEAAHGYVPSHIRMNELPDSLLRADVLDALDGLESTDMDGRRRYRFRREWFPYKHQVESWETLSSKDKKSLLVTSGTGSGKTECFLVPLINDLATQAAAGHRLVGVQAIMLYPLNALINSQKERLSDWLSPFKGKIRFALFNGETPETARDDLRDLTPEEVIDRTDLRANPPPILVTNITMLEYMLIRYSDQAILNQSNGKLKYVILDEAHSYVGSQAAELSLLLRRVLRAFGVEAKNVRFVATSATIGKTGDAKTREGLRDFLAQVGGIPREQVVVVEGHRQEPWLPKEKPDLALPSPGELAGMSTASKYERIASTPAFRKAFRALNEKPMSRRDFFEIAGIRDPVQGTAILTAAAGATRDGKDDGEKLLPLKIHAFHRAQPGAWACINSSCEGKNFTALDDLAWPYGSVHLEQTDKCPKCDSLVFEIKFCSACEQVSLASELVPEKDGSGRQRLAATDDKDEMDEFFSPLESMEPEPDDDQATARRGSQVPEMVAKGALVFGPVANTVPWFVSPKSGMVLETEEDGCARYSVQDHLLACPHCQATFLADRRLLPLRVGAPFLLGNVVPELLDDADQAPHPRKNGKEDFDTRPADGRVLLMFSDSRQGTARVAAKLQRDAEQNHVRSFIYHSVQAQGRAVAEHEQQSLIQKIEEWRRIIAAVPTPVPLLNDSLAKAEEELASLGQPKPIKWIDIRTTLAQDPQVEKFMREKVWVKRESTFENKQEFAQFLLLREFLRQPLRGNSAETMGLSALTFEHFEKITDDRVPEPFTQHGGNLNDWRDFLYQAVLKVARSNWCAIVPEPTQHWIWHKLKTKFLQPPGVFATDGNIQWPNESKVANLEKRQIVKLLAQGLELSLDDAKHRDAIDECLRGAWSAFQGICTTSPSGYALNFDNASLSAVREAYACQAVPGLFRERAFRGLSPVAKWRGADFLPAERVRLPVLPFPFARNAGVPVPQAAIKDWLNDDEDVRELRRRGLWSDLHDRIAQYAVFFRAAEHSAQQPGYLLKSYEAEFKVGRLNVLSCSTTMEMGVDIGSISTVVMTNVPPSIASYRQRVGRAGRSKQELALAFTLCKNTPLDRAVFRDPKGFLEQSIYPPRVALDSIVIAQRHVNATMLARFLADEQAQLHRLKVGPFFGVGEAGELPEALSAKFGQWLNDETLRDDPDVLEGLTALLIGTPLEGRVNAALDATRELILKISSEVRTDWQSLRDDIVAAGNETARVAALTKQMKDLVREFLLSDLASRGFLPGYGFPTNVVTFDNVYYGDFKRKKQPDDNPGSERPERPEWRSALRGMPSRQLDLAIRDYAPGSDVVIDGRVFRSAGIKLAWKRPVTQESYEQIETMGNAWRCAVCGAIGTTRSAPSMCASCGADKDRMTIHRYLKPTGFACDPMDKPHDKVESVSYIPPKTPWVAARGGEWAPISVDRVGRTRASRDGIVFHHTLGAMGHGYAICLACGRAEQEDESLHQSPAVHPGLASHRPLKPRRDSPGRCIGLDPSRPFSIQRHQALGYEVKTDVFELQLEGTPSLEIAMPIAAAFRDALAEKLGVEADEMGLTASQTKDENDVARWSILIFDKASGGAGFSVSAMGNVEELLRMALVKLDCPAGRACIRGCPECIMSRDVQFLEENLDRQGAWSFLDTVVKRLALPPEIAIMGPDTRIEPRPVADAVVRAMDADQERGLRVWMTGDPQDWDFGGWPLGNVMKRLGDRQRKTELVIDANVLKGLDEAGRLELFGFSAASGCEIRTGSRPRLNGDFGVVAWVGAERKGRGWALKEIDGADVLLTGPLDLKDITLPFDVKTLLRRTENMAVIKVRAHLDEQIVDFGQKFWELIGQDFARLRDVIKSGEALKSVEYVDRYLNSPLPVRLMREVLVRTPNLSVETVVKVETANLVNYSNSSSLPSLISHDWRQASHRDGVIHSMLTTDFGSSAVYRSQPKRLLPHGRKLTLKYASGAVVIRLDQGFGHWDTAVSMSFPFTSDVASQASRIVSIGFKARANSAHDTVITVTKE